MHNRKRILIPVIVLLLLGSLAGWYLARNGSSVLGGSLEASGTVEAVEVAVAAELSGRVVEVLVEEGQPVNAGDALLRLDDALLVSQRQRAEAALRAAQENLAAAKVGEEMANAALTQAEAALETANAQAEAERLTAQQALDQLYENAAVARAEAERNVAAANRLLRDAQYLWDNFTIPSSQKNLTAMEAISMTQQKLAQARAAFEPYKNESSGNPTRETLKDRLDEAQSDYDTAVRRMELETGVLQARERLEKALRDLEKLKDGPDPDEVAKLEARIAAIQAAPKQAQAAVEQARVAVEQAQVKVSQAEAALAQAQAELNWINVQIEKLTVYAPVSGVLLSRNVEPGEVIQAGAAVMTLGQLDQLKITVYIPEDRYGQIKLGQKAQVSVDSFPGKTFQAEVVRIADKAEFTPRNVQTAEGRKTTVFAIQLSISNPDGQLKPGMPADVRF